MKKENYSNNGLKTYSHKLLSSKIKQLFRNEADQDFDINKIKRKLKVTNSKNQIEDILNKLQKDNFIIISNRGKLKINKELLKQTETKNKTILPDQLHYTGIVDKTKTGSAYILIKELPYDVFIPNRYMLNAMDGDTVRVELLLSKQRTKKDGKIIDIISRAKSQYVGIFKSYPNYSTVFVEGNKDEFEVYIPHPIEFEINDGSKVLIEITEWRGRVNQVPWGKLVSVFDSEDLNDIEMKSILVNNGFTIDFPDPVKQEAFNLDKSISQNEILKRRDFREILTFTIDPDTAQDFDDALSYRIVDSEHIEIGVHIADVTHFVRPDTEIDKEALKRSTSVYLVDRVAPMLPEELSNELCSLRPDEESLTFSAVFTFDKEFKITDRWFGKTIIHSDKRFTYEEAQTIIDNQSGIFYDELKVLNDIAKKLRHFRFQHGSIDFETDEVKFILDDKGNPIDLYVKQRLESHMLIEEFMLLANKEVATFMVKKAGKNSVPFVFRVHDLPDQDKLNDFALFVKELGLKIKLDTPKQVIRAFNDLSKKAGQDERFSFLIPLALRTMAKAIYTTDNIGHFGLGFDNYTHFTSPIRRYSDVLVHRILEKNLSEINILNKTELEDKCRHISEQERRAINAERESVKYKQVQYIANYVGQEFEGRISGFIEKGMFVELNDSKVEGMIEFNTMGQYFTLNEAKNKIAGSENGSSYKMGDVVKIRVKQADLTRRRVDFEFIDSNS